jgi:hypothetical protein
MALKFINHLLNQMDIKITEQPAKSSEVVFVRNPLSSEVRQPCYECNGIFGFIFAADC